MNTVESRLLSILRPDEMLRFVLIPDGSGKIDFGIEGCSENPRQDALLAERLSLVLGGLRASGYVFGKRMKKLDRAPQKRPRKSNRSKPSFWVEIRPRTIDTRLGALAPLGFVPDCGELSGSKRLLLPDLPTSVGPRSFEPPASFVVSLPQVERLEIEFVGTVLAEDWAKGLEEALRLETSNRRGLAQFDRSTLTEVFLSLWLWHRTGFLVKARAQLRSGSAIPVAPLEMIGRDLFLCECEVARTVERQTGNGAVDLGESFPRTWPFPPILPPPETFELLSAPRFHNRSLPDLPAKGLKIGMAEDAAVRLPLESRDRHTYLVGATGTGKSTLLFRMIREDMERGEGVILLDPHGDLFRSVQSAVPDRRRHEVLLIDPEGDSDLPGLNILDIPSSRFSRRHAMFVVGELFRLFEETWNMRAAGGPVFEMYFRNTLLLMCLQSMGNQQETAAGHSPAMAKDETIRKSLAQIFGEEARAGDGDEDPIRLPPNMSDFTRVMADKEFRKKLLAGCTEKSVVQFWNEVAEKTSGDYKLENFVPYIVSKVNAFVQTGVIADLVCAPRNDLRIEKRMERGEIVLVNLNKGLLGAYESKLLGTILMMEIFAAGLSRSQVPETERTPVNLYVDEFQNFVSDNVASMLSEARKFGLRLTLANQTLAQLNANQGRQDLLETVLGNVGNMILFRLGVPDAERLGNFFEPFSRQDIQELPNFHALVRLLTPEGPVRPLILKTLMP